MNPLISLIIPVYNVEAYLQKCFDSVVAQTYQNLEVIVVNDGSTDGSLTVCNRYVKKNGWKLISQENGGLSAARNTGLLHANGEYITFLDSDDWMADDLIETLLYKAIQYGSDIVEAGFYRVYPDQVEVDISQEERVFSAQEVLAALFLETYNVHPCVWGKLYSRRIFENLSFEVGRLHEDGYFIYQAMYKSSKYCLLNYAGYYYRQDRPGSIMTVRVKPKNILDVTDLLEQRIEFFSKNEELELKEMAEAYYFRTTLTNYITSIKVLADPILADSLNKKILKNRNKIFRNRYLKVKKLKFALFFFAPRLFKQKYLKRIV